MEDVELEEYTQLKFKQLEIANNSVLLIYTRDRTDHALAKKLRPEFKKVLISTELKDCQKIISKITNETKDEAPVDVVRGIPSTCRPFIRLPQSHASPNVLPCIRYLLIST